MKSYYSQFEATFKSKKKLKHLEVKHLSFDTHFKVNVTEKTGHAMLEMFLPIFNKKNNLGQSFKNVEDFHKMSFWKDICFFKEVSNMFQNIS